MPWSQLSAMDQKRLFIADYLTRSFSTLELCRRYGVSRPTGYKWLSRFADSGYPGLEERSRRPLSCPHQTDSRLVQAILELRGRHPFWGPKKLRTILGRRHPEIDWPAPSTMAAILKRHGLIEKKRRRTYPGHPGKPETRMSEPNETWCADFKGEFKTRDGLYCYPLTITDGYSRYLLECRGLPTTSFEHSQPVFKRIFQEYGLPQVLRTDNGVPFATQAIGRLSRLSAWWIRLGVYPELIQPGRPQQNGRHERMHRTLKRETTRPPAATRRGQQRRFESFKQEYNHVRPHEALNQRTPASAYKPSRREYPSRLPPLEYPEHFEKRLVSRNGGYRWAGRRVPLSHVLAELYVGLEEVDDGIWDVYFGTVLLGQMDERNGRVEDALGRRMRRSV